MNNNYILLYRVKNIIFYYFVGSDELARKFFFVYATATTAFSVSQSTSTVPYTCYTSNFVVMIINLEFVSVPKNILNLANECSNNPAITCYLHCLQLSTHWHAVEGVGHWDSRTLRCFPMPRMILIPQWFVTKTLKMWTVTTGKQGSSSQFGAPQPQFWPSQHISLTHLPPSGYLQPAPYQDILTMDVNKDHQGICSLLHTRIYLQWMLTRNIKYFMLLQRCYLFFI